MLSKQLVSTDFGPAYDENLSAGGVQECIEKLARAEKYSHPNERVSTAVIDAVIEKKITHTSKRVNPKVATTMVNPKQSTTTEAERHATEQCRIQL